MTNKEMRRDGFIFLALAFAGAFTWGSSFINSMRQFDYADHYTEWLNPMLMTVVLYSFPFGVLVLMATFGILAIKDPKPKLPQTGSDIQAKEKEHLK